MHTPKHPRALAQELEQLADELGELQRFHVWTWTPGRPWRLDVPDVLLHDVAAALVWLTPGTSGAAFSIELDANPNRMRGADVLDLADFTAGPIPDLAHTTRSAAA